MSANSMSELVIEESVRSCDSFALAEVADV